jgi:hypothetical protein
MEPERALAELGQELKTGRYRFTPVGAATRKRVNLRGGHEQAHTLVEVFGWGRPWAKGLVPARLVGLLEQAGALLNTPEGLRSRIGFATIGERLVAHAADPVPGDTEAWPLHAGCGPDAWRYAALLRLAARPARLAVELNCGCGVGGLTLAGQVRRLVLADADPLARLLARTNALLARCEHVQVVASAGIDAVLSEAGGGPDPAGAAERAEPPDLIVAGFGRALPPDAPAAPAAAAACVRAALARLAPGGRLVLYAVVPVNHGDDPLWRAVGRALVGADPAVAYEELDPDLAPDELPPGVGEVPPERSAAIGVVATMAGTGTWTAVRS